MGTAQRRLLLAAYVLLLFVGIGIMAYPTVSSLVNARTASEVINSYGETVAALSEEEIAAVFAAADRYNERLSTSEVVMTDPFDENAVRYAGEGYDEVLDLDGNGLMAYIDVPSIGVHLPIYHGTTSDVLVRSVGHLQGTSLPVGGESTHTVLSAHTGMTEARLFTDLDRLEEGDTFSITVLNEVLTYEVYDIEVVEPTDTESLNVQPGEDLCTLVTCTPRGINSHRLLVHAMRIPTPVDAAADVAQPLNFSWRYFAVGAAVALAAMAAIALLVWRSRRRRARIRMLWRELLTR